LAFLKVEASQCNKILASALSEILAQAAPDGHSIKLVILEDNSQVTSSVVEEVPINTEEQPIQQAEVSPAQPAKEIEVCSSDFHDRLQ
jgi:hypothetical protein